MALLPILLPALVHFQTEGEITQNAKPGNSGATDQAIGKCSCAEDQGVARPDVQVSWQSNEGASSIARHELPNECDMAGFPGRKTAVRISASDDGGSELVRLTRKGILTSDHAISEMAKVVQYAGARFAVITSSHEASLGMKLSLSRRLAIPRWAAETGAWVIADDYYGRSCLTG